MGLLLGDAAAHEEAAVAAAVAAERAACAQVFGACMQCSPAVAAALADIVRQVLPHFECGHAVGSRLSVAPVLFGRARVLVPIGLQVKVRL